MGDDVAAYIRRHHAPSGSHQGALGTDLQAAIRQRPEQAEEANPMSTVITIATIVVALALIGWFMLSKNPAKNEQQGIPSHEHETRADVLYSDDRPAGPDAEEMDPDAMLGHRQDWSG